MDKQEVWQHIIKPIMVVSMWLLAVGALVAIICGGVRSCSNKQVAARENDTAENVGQTTTPLKMKRDVVSDSIIQMESPTTVVFTENHYSAIAEYYDIPYWQTTSGPADIPSLYHVDYLNGISLLYNGEYVKVSSITSRFLGASNLGHYNEDNTYTMPIRFQWSAFVLENGLNYDFLITISSAGEGLTNMGLLHSSNGVSLDILKGDLSAQHCWALSYCYHEVNSQGFIFNNQINYNAPLNSNLGSAYIINNESTTLAKIVNYDFDFISGGEFFNRLQVVYIRGGGGFEIDDLNIEQVLNNDIISYGYLSYVNTFTNTSRAVNYRLQLQYEHEGGISYYNAKSSYWSAQTYRDITIVGQTSNENLINLQKFNNNTIALDNGITGNTSSVFDLLGSAFGSVASILAMSVLPGISLGLLVFIPVVLVIIMALFKLLRK